MKRNLCRDCRQAFPASELDVKRRCCGCRRAYAAKLEDREALDAWAKRLLLAGLRSAQIRDLVGIPESRIDAVIVSLTDDERLRREAALAASATAAAHPRTFAVPTPTGGRICGRLDGNPGVVEAVRMRTGLDPWDFEEQAA